MEMESKKKKRNLHIPDDIIFNILRSLPPKSLARFKCVCKSWQSFANQHKYHNQKLILFSSNTIQSVDFEADEMKAVDLDIPFKVSNNPILGIASCNGLLYILTEREGLVIWNPLIRRYKRVSNTSEYDKFGFWYDHSTDNYKIVRFMRFFDPKSERKRYSAEIYQNWIRFMNLPPFSPFYHYLVPICLMEDEILVSVRPLPRLLLYNPKAKAYKEFHIRDTMKHIYKEITYIDSLISP